MCMNNSRSIFSLSTLNTENVVSFPLNLSLKCDGISTNCRNIMQITLLAVYLSVLFFEGGPGFGMSDNNTN